MKVLMVGPIEKAGGVSTHTKELTRALKKLGVEVEIYNISPNKEYPGIISNIIKLYKRTVGLSLKLVRDSEKFDLIHVQASGPLGGFLPAPVGVLWKKILGYKLVVTFHYSWESFYSKYRHMLSLIIKFSDKFIVVSHRNKRLITKYIPRSLSRRILVVYNGFSSDIFKPMDKNIARKLLDIPPDAKVIVNIANLVEHKGHKYLIEAVKMLREQVPKLKCYVIGKGHMYQELSRLIEQYNLKKHVKLTGWMPLEKIILYLNSADVFVFPSLPQGESFGIVQIEAMGCGVPVVATKNGVSEEIIVSEDYGLLCEPANPKDLAEKILIALDREWDREKIRKYAEQFTWDRIAKKTLEVYSMVIKNEHNEYMEEYMEK
ncbi:glycosyltransferase family 4 protein [Pyrococcus kukulkanii]|uniref:Glycosyl transferase n=1 Tax=Pyrococcus kukulkanii TaxID=1609559 RepID=A0A127BA54_9EURY|nr:glycosyltransferase family 4 protein [Pyrococcus kukulkanii]AMM53546.1 hypothetical protein TQ32_02905 [Pyrococcus kukulkanii]